jgi:hypothetical protein
VPCFRRVIPSGSSSYTPNGPSRASELLLAPTVPLSQWQRALMKKALDDMDLQKVDGTAVFAYMMVIYKPYGDGGSVGELHWI